MQFTTIQPRTIEHKRSSAETPLIVVTKKISAPVTAVFHAWKDIDLIKQWWGPEGSSCPFAEVNFHVGEKYLLEIENKNGLKIWSTGIYVEIDPYRTLVFSYFSATSRDEVSARMGTPKEPNSDAATAFVTVEFEDLEDNLTNLTLCHEGIHSVDQNQWAQDWSSSLEKLKSVVELQH